MTILRIILIWFILCLMILEIINIVKYGWFVNKETKHIYSNIEESDYRLNWFDDSILSINDKKHISTHFSLISKYHISDKGIVLRWSKLHKKINEYYKIARLNKKI